MLATIKNLNTSLCKWYSTIAIAFALGSTLNAQPTTSNPGTTGQVLTGAINIIQWAPADPFGHCWNYLFEFPDCEAQNGGQGASCSQGTCITTGPSPVAPPSIPQAGGNAPGIYSSFSSNSGSSIDNTRFAYSHWADDLRKQEGSSLSVRRIFHSREFSRNGSFGPGTFSNFDVRLSTVGPNGGLLYDPINNGTFSLVYNVTAEEIVPDIVQRKWSISIVR